MTDRQIRAEKTARLSLSPSTVSNERVLNELWCREMINGILAYGDETDLEPGANYYDVYLSKFEHKLGHETFRRLCTEQISDFRKAHVFKTCDEHGCAFVSVTWADDIRAELR